MEIPAATALEARVQRPSRGQRGPVDGTVRFTAVWMPIIAGCLYTWGALIVSFDLKWDDINLPRVSWLPKNEGSLGPVLAGTSDSGFVIIAKESLMNGLSSFVTAGLVISAMTAANTTLYVASRTLFGLTRGVEASSTSPYLLQFLAYLGKTDQRKVPVRAIVASCFFCWVPFLYLSPTNRSGTAIGSVGHSQSPQR